jgi:ParB family transcriptional regulator, chromosome partitioning protein
MTNPVVAESTARVAEKEKVEKEKVEKRRALGRGLESLLPGPRVVGSGPGQSVGSAAKQQGPFDSVSPSGAAPLRAGSHFVRNDKAVSSEGAGATGVSQQAASAPISIQAVVEPTAAAELRSAGQPGAAVPTQPIPSQPVSAAVEDAITISAQAESRMPGNLVINLAIADIDKNPFQTRYVDDDDALEELSESIKTNGVVQPIMVRPGDEDGRYILVLGERRLLASKKAGKTTIPALVRRVSLQQAAEMTIIENLQREDLSALEQAEAFRVLSKEFSLTQAQIGERVGLSRESVANYMRLLKLPREVMQLLAEKKITFGEAKELLKLENDDQITQGALYAVKKGLSLEQIERMVLSMNGLLDPFPGMPGQVTKKTGGGARWVDPNVRAAQTDLERTLGLRVRIRDRKGKGKIVIEYHTVDDYERVVEMLRGKSS